MKQTWCRIAWVGIGAAMVLVLVLVLAVRPAASQLIAPGRKGDEVTNIFLPAPRALRQQLTRARKALEEERYTEAVDLLGSLLADPRLAAGGPDGTLEQDYFVGEPGPEGTQTSLKAEAQQLLGSMPAKGRELYELKFGAEARRLLDQALQNRDVRALTEVTRRYFHTAAGYEATMLIGRLELDQGRPLAAALCFQRLLQTPHAAEQYDPELSVLVAICWQHAGQIDRARQALLALKQRMPAATLRVGAKNMSLFNDPDDVLTWLDSVVGQGFDIDLSGAAQWVMYRGDAARNAASAAGFPLLNARWRVRVANHPSDEQLISESQHRFWDQSIPAFPGLHPLAVANVILMRTPRRLLAVDFATGKRVWEFPWFDSPEDEVATSELVRPQTRTTSNRLQELQQRVWDDAAYGQLSSDGQRVFLLWELGFADPNMRQLNGIVLMQGRVGPNPHAPRDSNKLVALDLQHEGKLQWIVGGQDGTDEPKLAGAFFLGAPLPLMGHLYVMAEFNGEIRLVVLDADSGRLEWSQQLAHLDMRKIIQDAPRRLAGATPSFSDGILVCPTSAGAIVAVDISTRSLLWGFQYPQDGAPTHVMMGARRFNQKPLGERWADATVTVADGRVLVTPIESDSLFCLDLLTGQPAWKPRPRGSMLYLACVRERTAVLVGKQQLEALSVDTGEPVWTLAIPEGMPSGRGMLADRYYYLGTTAGQLLKIDLESGKLVRQSPTDQVLGNLVAYQDQIISQGVEWLSAYYQTDPLREQVAARLQQAPDDLWALARQAELLLYDGNRMEAIAVLRRALQLKPDDDTFRALLVSSILLALKDDFAAHRELADGLDQMINRPAERLEYFRLMAIGLQNVGQPDKALDYYFRLAALQARSSSSESPDRVELIQVEPQLRSSRDRWIRGQITRMLQTATAEQRQTLDATIQQHLDQILTANSTAQLALFVEHFAGSSAVARAQLALARQYADHGLLLAAEQHLIDLTDAADPHVAAEALAVLAHLLHTAGNLPEAATCYQQLAERWPSVVVQDGKTGAQLLAEARQDAEIAAALEPLHRWPVGQCTVAPGEAGSQPFASFHRIFGIQLNEVHGPFPTGAALAYNYNLNSLEVRNRYGQSVQQMLLGDRNRFYSSIYSTNQANVRGHLVLASIGFEVLAIDILNGTAEQGDAVLWRADLSGAIDATGQRSLMADTINRPWGPPRSVPKDRSRQPIGLAGPITRCGVYYQKMQDLICADPLTGQTIWKRSGIDPGADVFGDDQYLFVVAPEGSDALVLNAIDGSELGTRPVASRSERWITRGRNVLACTVNNDQLQIRWFDAWESKDLWQHSFEAKAQCWQVDQESIAVAEPSGQFVVLDLNQGTALAEAQLKPEPDLVRLFVLASADRYVIVPSRQSGRSASSSVTGIRIYGVSLPDMCPLIDGRVYALNRQTGKLEWSEPATIRQFSLPLDQPTELPVLTFFRHVNTRKTQGNSRSSPTTASVLCVDARDGRQLLYEQDLPMIQYYAVLANPEQNSVAVTTNARNFLLTFTDEPVKDAHPVQIEDPTAAINALKEVGKIANSILEAMSKPAAKQEAKPADKQDAADQGQKEPDRKEAQKESTDGGKKEAKQAAASDAKPQTAVVPQEIPPEPAAEPKPVKKNAP